MLTIKNVTPAQGENYFKQENYYSKEEAKKHSQWSGQGAGKVKLQGHVESKEFKNLLEGYSPDRKKILTGKENKKNHRAAYDCTFSAPKSISIAALMGGQKELLEAHKQAVARTLEIIEQQYAQARVWDGEKQYRVNTGNLIVGQFHHTTSREKDPQLHTHCVIINATQLPDGRWRALSNEELYRNKMLLGAIYRNELAQECRNLGYEIEPRKDELFEIKGYTQQQLDWFSKRRQHIIDLVGPNATAEEKQWAALYQRPPKGKELPHEELVGWWQAQDEALGLGIQHPVIRPEQSTQEVKTPEEVSLEAAEAVKVAIEHCSERAVAFKRQAIEKFVLSEIKQFSYSDLQSAIAKSPELIKTFDEGYTTQKALDRELATIRLMLQGKNQVEAIATPETVESYLEAERSRLAEEGKRLTQGQQEAVRLAATTQDQFIAWSGVAGAGKTYSLQLLKSIAEAQGYTVRGFAPSGAAAKVLGTELEMEAKTVASLLVSKQSEQVQPKQLWIVDEAGLLNANDGYKLLKRAREEGAQLKLVGDYRQMSAVEAGSPFRSLLSSGISVAYMNESLRQKTPELKKAADLAAAGQHADALAHLSMVGRIQQLAEREERTGAIAQDYLQLTPQERSQTLILAGTHKEKRQIMHSIREGLKAEGVLSRDEIFITRLKSKDLTSVQNRYVHHYQVGDVVMPMREYKRSGLHKFQPYFVEAIQDDKLRLCDLVGSEQLIDPMKFRKQVYQQESLDLAVGDRLKWTKTDKELGRTNGDEFVVMGLEGHTATIQYENGKAESLFLDQPLHLDYAIVSTTYSSQGKTADRALISSTIDQTVSQESTYVAISRTRHDLKIFAENTDFLMEQAQESGVQRNPLELLERKADPQTKEKVSVTKAVINAPPKEAASPVKGHPQPQQQAPLQAPSLQTGVETPASRPTRKPVKDQPQPVPKALTAKPRKDRPQPVPKALTPEPKPTPKHLTPKPQKLEPFWTPAQACPPPFGIKDKHWKELVEGSAIHPALAECNVETVAGNEVYERLLSTKLEQIGGSGQYVTQPAAKLMKAYEQVAEGGWWAKAGIDARSLPNLQPGQAPDLKLWGSFKADNPRVDAIKSQRKDTTDYIKYEHPLAEERQLFLFDVPDELAERIYNKHGIKPTDAEKQSSVWYVVHKYNLPITVTEGAKKTLSSLSQGEVTIGLSGVNGGYTAKDKDKNPLEQRLLHPELKIFATPGREFRFAFDHDTKLSTVFNVRRDMVRTGELLELEGSKVQVLQWKEDKGLDDLIVNQGPIAYAKAQAKPIPLAWEAQKHYRGEYTRLSRTVRNQQPVLAGEVLDAEVYRQAVLKGEVRDGARVVAQSDQARSLRTERPQQKADAKTLEYIRGIEQQISQSVKNPTHQEPNHDEDTQQPEQLLQSDTQQPAEPVAKALAESIEQSALESDSALAITLQVLSQRLNTLHEPDLPRALEALETAIAQHVQRLEKPPTIHQEYNHEQREPQPSRTPDQREPTPLHGRGLDPLARADRAPGAEAGAGAAGADRIPQGVARDLSEGLDTVVELQEVERLTEALERFDQRLGERQHSVAGAENLRRSVDQLHREVTARPGQSEARDLLKPLVDAVEHSAVESEPALASAIEELATKLNFLSQPARQEAGQQLEQSASAQSQQLEKLAEGIADYQEGRSLESSPELGQALENLSENLSQWNSPDAQVAVEQLTTSIASYTQQVEQKWKQARQQRISNLLKGIADSVEHSSLESDPLLPQTLDTLTAQLEQLSHSGPRESVARLTARIAAHTQELAAQLRQTLLTELADQIEQSVLEAEPELSRVLHRLSNTLDHLNPSRAKEAIERLTTSISDYIQLQHPAPSPAQISAFNISEYAHPAQWPVARRYLLEECLLPEVFVDALHKRGLVGADHQGRAMFIRHAINENPERGDVLGADLQDSSLGHRGHFWIHFGQGEPRRVLITSTPVDALSLAALERREQPSIYLSVNNAGAIPMAQWQQLLEQDVQVVVALNTDQDALTQKLLEQLPRVIQRQPTQGDSWNQQLQHQRTQALYHKYSNNGRTTDLVGITRNAMADGCSRELVSKILAHHPVFATQMYQKSAQEVEQQQQPQTPQPAKLSPRQLWQQYSQRTVAPNEVSKLLEVAQLALRDGVPEAEIRQILQANPYLQQFGEKGRRDLVEKPLAKAKRLVALSKMPSEQARQQSQERNQKHETQM